MYTSVRGQTLYGCEHGAKIHRWGQTLWVKQQVFEQAGEHWYKMSRPNVQKILYKNVQLVCLLYVVF